MQKTYKICVIGGEKTGKTTFIDCAGEDIRKNIPQLSVAKCIQCKLKENREISLLMYGTQLDVWNFVDW